MAGRPRERAMVLELEQRTRLYFEDDEHSILDYVCEWQADGKSLRALAAEITDDAGLNPELDPATIRRWLVKHYDREEVDTRLAEARERGAYALADDALDDAMKLDDKDQAPIIRVRNDTRHWTAQRYNRAVFGEQKAGVNVQLNIGALHIDAMRARALSAPAPGSTAHARSIPPGGIHVLGDGGGAIPEAIDVEAEVLSDDSVTS